MTVQPGYDTMADLYDQTFPEGCTSDDERSAVDAFAAEVVRSGLPGPVVDVGCGTGHQTADLASRGLPVIGVDPSAGMLRLARRRFGDVRLVQDDAHLRSLGDGPFCGVLARFSLIHVPPPEVVGVLASWAQRLPPGGVVLVAFQALHPEATEDAEEFDHVVAPAWRWRPDAMAALLAGAGFAERWRSVAAAGEGHHRFSECHLLAVREADTRRPTTG